MYVKKGESDGMAITPLTLPYHALSSKLSGDAKLQLNRMRRKLPQK